GDQIPILSRIISVADSYDAMTMRRAYHGTITHEHALKIMQSEKGTKLDAEILSIFIDVVKTNVF
ncbi:HD-GYP domain-containing protein, partial [Acidithiobacillus sp.]|uniref:HD-GYP domain-containing protein n=1 Tax=Acidithiobacillus sp. TaxID=1872118 RepID=UPI003D024EBC